ncbi:MULTISPECIES: hypothetical protein [Nostoc]|uniref:Uncharacterized protein n=2 Tax=Nostoc TaxID=1177 RepID=A0ABR8IJB6_9NOSO|nr:MULTISPECIES: hypothetical protein [Nostoc]MBD2565253.1 hypothetical protein [Nostoc linckia FACHB-391]MBD2650380.1 hypothetical protein [Nostoc foliaceum FACHB-393]
MKFWRKISVVFAIAIAVFLFQGTISKSAAQAATYKFTFTGEEANGYFIYDTAAKGETKSPYMTQYYGGGRDYKVDLGDKGLFQGTVSNAIVFLPREEDKVLAKIRAQHDKQYGIDDEHNVLLPADLFLLQVRSFERQPKSNYSLVSYFKYPQEAFNGSTKLPKDVPLNAEIEVFPKVDFPKTLGKAIVKAPVQTKIEKISD